MWVVGPGRMESLRVELYDKSEILLISAIHSLIEHAYRRYKVIRGTMQATMLVAIVGQ
jgi:hypothetical protein